MPTAIERRLFIPRDVVAPFNDVSGKYSFPFPNDDQCEGQNAKDDASKAYLLLRSCNLYIQYIGLYNLIHNHTITRHCCIRWKNHNQSNHH